MAWNPIERMRDDRLLIIKSLSAINAPFSLSAPS